MLNNWKDLQLSYNSSNYSPRMIHYSLASIRELICAIFYKILLIISLVVAEITFKVIQDHWQWRYLIVHIWLTSSCPPKVCIKFLSTAGAAGLTKQIAGVEELIRQSKADDQERPRTYTIVGLPDKLQFIDVEMFVLDDFDQRNDELTVVDVMDLGLVGTFRPVLKALVLSQIRTGTCTQTDRQTDRQTDDKTFFKHIHSTINSSSSFSSSSNKQLSRSKQSHKIWKPVRFTYLFYWLVSMIDSCTQTLLRVMNYLLPVLCSCKCSIVFLLVIIILYDIPQMIH